jgi:hypothetical protein
VTRALPLIKLITAKPLQRVFEFASKPLRALFVVLHAAFYSSFSKSPFQLF